MSDTFNWPILEYNPAKEQEDVYTFILDLKPTPAEFTSEEIDWSIFATYLLAGGFAQMLNLYLETAQVKLEFTNRLMSRIVTAARNVVNPMTKVHINKFIVNPLKEIQESLRAEINHSNSSTNASTERIITVPRTRDAFEISVIQNELRKIQSWDNKLTTKVAKLLSSRQKFTASLLIKELGVVEADALKVYTALYQRKASLNRMLEKFGVKEEQRFFLSLLDISVVEKPEAVQISEL